MGARTESLRGTRNMVPLEPRQLRAPGTESSNEDPVSLCVAAPIAQLVELRTFNPQVLGSSPGGGTKTKREPSFSPRLWPALAAQRLRHESSPATSIGAGSSK